MSDEICEWRPSLTLMNEAMMKSLHQRAMEILEDTGLNVHHPEMRAKLVDAGARLMGGTRVTMSADMVNKALDGVNKDVVVFDRHGDPAMRLGPHQIYFGTGSDLIYTIDPHTGERRESRLEDVECSARLCDALDEIDFVMSFALPADAPNEDAEASQYHTILRNTGKPVIMTSFSGLESLDRVHAMACLVAGGQEAFRERPNYVLYGQFVSPLQHDRQAVERLIFCADHEVPLIYVPTIMCGASGPFTLAGSLSLALAEMLGGLVMHQAQRTGAPFITGACVSQLNMRTGLFPYGSAEWRLNDLVMAEMARHYGLPVFGTGGASDSKGVDAQAGAEYAGSLLVAALAGTNLIHDVGYLDSGLTGSLESIVLGAEQIRWVKRFLEGFEVSDGTLAAAVIAEIGPAGEFLSHEHTLQYLRPKMWRPLVVDHTDYDTWSADGAADYAARAREYARDLIGSHRVKPLASALDAELGKLSGGLS